VQTFLDQAKTRNAELIDGNRGPEGKGYYLSPTLHLNPEAVYLINISEPTRRWMKYSMSFFDFK
ncbi:hypothetical protein ACVGWF_00425, partial [Enterobacter asburiae]